MHFQIIVGLYLVNSKNLLINFYLFPFFDKKLKKHALICMYGLLFL